MSLKSAAALSMVALLCAAGAARADIVHFVADLTGKDEVPANSSAATGNVTAELETTERTLAYRATYKGLSGPATMAHFHGPAAPGANGPPVITVPDNAKLPIGGSVRGYLEFSASFAALQSRLWPGWQSARPHVYSLPRLG